MGLASAIYNSVRGGVSFNPATDIPPLNGKVILVTGGNSGLGKSAIKYLVQKSPARIWLASRDASRAQAAIDEIVSQVPSASTVIKPLSLDLASFASIKSAARQVLAESDRLDILMLNAGIMATPADTTKEGYEIQFGTNHVGHALLTKLLLPLLLKTTTLQQQEQQKPDVRVVVVSSAAHRNAPACGIVFDTLRTPQTELWAWARYGQSKLANILFAKELARRYPHPQLTVVAVHPGVVNSNLAGPLSEQYRAARLAIGVAGRIFFSSTDVGAKNQLWAATALEGVQSGKYYHPVGVTGWASDLALDDGLARKLWDWTEKELDGESI
jgi:NAD(P)-dependent dehydrogenase (short-subunit alcohol dehydrogenase family)